MSRRLRSWLQTWFNRRPTSRGDADSAPHSIDSENESIAGTDTEHPDTSAVSADATQNRHADLSLTPRSRAHDERDRNPSTAALDTAAHEIEAIVGIDFGTSTVKIVIRLPFEQGDPTFAVPAIGAAQAEGDPDLWVSRVWLDRNLNFRLDGSQGGEPLAGLKATLMRDADTVLASSHRVVAKEAVCACLALLLNEARQWFLSHHRNALASGIVRWTYHFGFPAASLDNIPLRDHYQRCAAAALLLVPRGSISLAEIREALDSLTSESNVELSTRQGALFPEVAAAVAGFAHTQRRDDGLYALIDVGAGTLDCCTFNLARASDGTMRCPIFAADVAMLGVEPWRACRDVPTRLNDFIKELDRRPRTVIWRTRQWRYPDSPRWTTALPLFLIGGGAASEVHRAMAEGLDRWIRSHLKTGNGGVRLLELPLPANFQHRCSHERVHRLAVAVGLSLPDDMIPQVELPHVIDDVAPSPMKGFDELYVDKSMV
jgi:hypothetical protein